MNNKQLNSDQELQAYIIGLALGDGNLSRVRKTTRLRISCDKKYPFLYKKIISSLELLLPNNKVSIVNHPFDGGLDVSVYSNHIETLLGWKAKSGSKFSQKVSVPSWIKESKQYTISCLRGLIETDGSIYNDRGYKMMIFTSIIPELANDFQGMMNSLGFKSHLYKIDKSKLISKFHQQTLYHIRLSKSVSEFLALIKPEKA